MLVLPPRLAGLSAFSYHGSSMRGTFRPGDILWVAPVAPRRVCRGDVIAYRRLQGHDGSLVVAHRVQALVAGGLIMQSDGDPSPGGERVNTGAVVGHVRFVERDGRLRRVWQGRAGQLRLPWLHTIRPWLMRFAGRPYRWLRASGLARHLWQPTITQVNLAGREGPLVKYVCGRRTVACWWPAERRFWCRRPYDLVLSSPAANPAEETQV